MAQRIRAADVLRSLQAQHLKLRQEVTALSSSQRALLLRHALLSAWCEALSHIQMVGGIQQPDGIDCDVVDSKFRQLFEKETQLLQQLSPAGGHLGAQVSLKQLLQPDSNTIAPSTDPMAYLIKVACNASPEQRQRELMDPASLAAGHKRASQSVGMKLHQLETAPPGERPGLVKQMADVWDGYFAGVTALVLSGNAHAVEKAAMVNLETMQLEPAASSAHQAAQAAVVVPLLQLTAQQMELIPIAMELHYDLLAAIHQERHAINSQMTAVIEAAAADSAADAAASASAHSTSAHTAPARDASAGDLGNRISSSRAMCSRGDPLQELSDRRARLQQQQVLAIRLKQLLYKEYILRLAAMGWFVGSLTYQQVSRLAAASWPYSMRVLFLATEIMQQARTQAALPKRTPTKP